MPVKNKGESKMQWEERLVNLRRGALVIVDVQNDYCHPEGAFGQAGADLSMIDDMTASLKALLQSARKARIPVVWIQTIHEEATDSAAWKWRLEGVGGRICRKGSWGAEFYGVALLEEEVVVIKHRYSAFIHTRLESVLRTLQAEVLMIAGVSTNVCVESTARDGFMLDYQIVLVEDCCASYSREYHDMTLNNIRDYFGMVAKSGQVMEAWDRLSAPSNEEELLRA